MNAKLYHGDCRKIMQTFEAWSLDAIVTDPPYGVLGNDNDWDVWPGLETWFEIARVLKPTGILAFTIAPHVADERLPDVKANGFRTLEVGFWVYGSGRPVTRHRLKRNYDLVYFMSCGGSKLYPENGRLLNRACASTGRTGSVSPSTGRIGRQFGAGKRSTYFAGTDDYFPSNVACLPECDDFGKTNYPLIFAIKRLLPVNHAVGNHPTQKPIDLMAQIVKLTSQPGDVVLDPFMGSGAIGQSTLLLGRRFIGIEQKQEYYDMAEKNINAILAQPALLPEADSL